VRPFIPGLRRRPLAGFRVVAPECHLVAPGPRRGHSPLISEEPVAGIRMTPLTQGRLMLFYK